MSEKPTPSPEKLRVALVGCGRWGSRLLAALARHPLLAPCVVCDPRPAAQASARRICPSVPVRSSLRASSSLGPVAAIIATASEDHAASACEALDDGLDVLVEKPMALRSSEARHLVELARRRHAVAMVGHVLRFHPAYQRLVSVVRDGLAGGLEQVLGRRLTQSGSPAPLWTLGPHDLCTLHALDPSPVCEVAVTTVSDDRGDHAAELELALRLASGLRARFRLATSAPVPARELVVRGRYRVLGVDELDACSGVRVAWPADSGQGEDFPLAASSLRVLAVASADPLAAELDHFAACVLSRAEPMTSFEEGAWVVDVLERAQTEAARRGAWHPVAAAAQL